MDKSLQHAFVAGMTPVFALFGDLGGGEVLMIGILALMLFGSKRLPELGRAFGRAMREFKRATSGVEENLREVMREDPLAPMLRPAARQVSRNTRSTAPVATIALPPAATPTTTTPAPSIDSPPATPPPEKAAGAEDEIAS